MLLRGLWSAGLITPSKALALMFAQSFLTALPNLKMQLCMKKESLNA